MNEPFLPLFRIGFVGGSASVIVRDGAVEIECERCFVNNAYMRVKLTLSKDAEPTITCDSGEPVPQAGEGVAAYLSAMLMGMATK